MSICVCVSCADRCFPIKVSNCVCVSESVSVCLPPACLLFCAVCGRGIQWNVQVNCRPRSSEQERKIPVSKPKTDRLNEACQADSDETRGRRALAGGRLVAGGVEEEGLVAVGVDHGAVRGLGELEGLEAVLEAEEGVELRVGDLQPLEQVGPELTRRRRDAGAAMGRQG